jgi:hypothetical protein
LPAPTSSTLIDIPYGALERKSQTSGVRGPQALLPVDYVLSRARARELLRGPLCLRSRLPSFTWRRRWSDCPFTPYVDASPSLRSPSDRSLLEYANSDRSAARRAVFGDTLPSDDEVALDPSASLRGPPPTLASV